MSLKLEERKIEIDGHIYTLRCNMSVLDRLQDQFDGSIDGLLELSPAKAVFVILKAMLDDCCEDENLPEIPMKRLKKLFGPAQLAELGVLRLMTASIRFPDSSEPGPGSDTGTAHDENRAGN